MLDEGIEELDDLAFLAGIHLLDLTEAPLQAAVCLRCLVDGFYSEQRIGGDVEGLGQFRQQISRRMPGFTQSIAGTGVGPG